MIDFQGQCDIKIHTFKKKRKKITIQYALFRYIVYSKWPLGVSSWPKMYLQVA